MLDYKSIEALHAVIELQSFEAAAKKLHITQSAVSQRIKNLETYYGETILIRIQPYKPTELGKFLIGHFKRVCLLEDTLEQQMQSKATKLHIAIALNRDSLETWFLDLINKIDLCQDILLEIIADDQDLTLDYFKKGLVSACLSTSSKEITGSNVTFLGNMEYLLVASPQFIKHYFPHQNSTKKQIQYLLEAPALKFDKNDVLHEHYLEKFFNLHKPELNYQIIPSVRGFKQYALLGYGYGLIPKIDIIQELKEKKLIQLYNDKILKVPLFWHSWKVTSKVYQKFNANVIRYAKDYF